MLDAQVMSLKLCLPARATQINNAHSIMALLGSESLVHW